MKIKGKRIPIWMYFVLIAVVLYVLGSCVWIFFKETSFQKTLVSSSTLKDKGSAESYYKQYEELVEKSGPRLAMAELKNKLRQDPILARNCHGVAHRIGQATLKKMGSFKEAAVFQDAICNSGFIHGVIESVFKDSRDISQDMSKVCAGATSNLYENWECYHGIGHGVMYYTNNNLPLSLQFCKSLKSEFEIGNCSNGVYMENFNSESSLHPSEYVKNDDYFYPCNDEKAINRDACYYYAPLRYLEIHNHEYDAAMRWCEEAGEFSRSCRSGVSGQAVKDSFDDLGFVQKVCQTLDGVKREECIRSAVTMVVNMNGETSQAAEFCQTLSEASLMPACMDQVKLEGAQFENKGHDKGVIFKK